jgi:hypothetical protein
VARSGSEALPLLRLLCLGHVAVQRMCSAATLGEKPVSRTGLSPRVVLLAGLREHSRETESRSRTRGCESGASIEMRSRGYGTVLPVRFVVTNDREASLRVVVEPWGDFVDLPAGGSIGVISSDTETGYVNIVSTESLLALWAEGDRSLELRLAREGDSTPS